MYIGLHGKCILVSMENVYWSTWKMYISLHGKCIIVSMENVYWSPWKMYIISMENVYWSPWKIAFVPFRIIWNLNFVDSFSKNNRKSNFTKIRSVGGELFLADRRTDGAKLTVASRNFFKAPKNTTEDHRTFWFLQQWNVKRITHH